MVGRHVDGHGAGVTRRGQRPDATACRPTPCITGITGQDGQYLAEFLHDKGYQVFGLVQGQNNPKARRWSSDELPFVELVRATCATCRR